MSTSPAAPAESTSPASAKRSPHLWTASTYFAEGFPYNIVISVADVLFVEHKASLQTIGLTSIFHLPWNLKFLVGPFLDAYATKRAWILWTEVALCLAIAALALTAAMPNILFAASIAFIVVAILSAIHDIAVDGFYLEVLDKDEQAKFVGYRAPAYRAAMLLVAGPLVVLTKYIGWTLGFAVMAVLFTALTFFHAWYLPKTETPKKPIGQLFSRTKAEPTASGRSFYVEAFVDFLAQPWALRIIAFVVLFRTGESLLMKMKYPFFKTLGLTMADYGVANGTIGMLVALVTPALGGWLIAKQGLRKWIWPFVLAQNTLHLLFAWAALDSEWIVTLTQTVFGIELRLIVVTAVIVVEIFGAGLGTAVQMVYMMRCCRPAFRAAHMAIVSALMSLSFLVAGFVSGYLADFMGFPLYFAGTFVVTIPAMVLIWFVPHIDEPGAPPQWAARI